MNFVKSNAAVKPAKYPTKRTVNLAKHESNKKNVMTIVIGLIIIAILVVLVVKFGVTDQFARLNKAESSYLEVHEQLTAMEESLTDYPSVEQEYHTYSRSWMTNGENSIAVSVDRTEVLDMIEKLLMSKGTVNSLNIQGDTVLVNMSGMNLEQTSVMLAEIQRQDMVESVKLTTASTKDTNEVQDFSLTIVLQSEEEEETK